MVNVEDKTLEDRVKNIEDKLEKLNDFLGNNAGLTTDLSVRQGAIEKLLIEHGVLEEDEVQSRVQEIFNQLIEKAEAYGRAEVQNESDI